MSDNSVRLLTKPWRALRFWQHGSGRTNSDADDELLQGIVETTPECIKIVARDGSLIHMNPAGLDMIQAESIAEVEGKSILGLIAPEHHEVWQANHERVCNGAKLTWDFGIIGLQGMRHHMETHAAPIEMPDGTIAQLAITRDITERKQAEIRQRALLDELHHRVKNNMQALAGLIRASQREAAHEEARQALASASERVDAMAAAHQALYDADDLESVDGHELIGKVCATIRNTFGPALEITTEAEGVKLPNDSAVPIALTLNELLTNAFKYGKNGRESVRVSIRLRRDDEYIILTVQDDGPGFTPRNTGRRASGLGLVRGMAKQIGGTLGIESQGGSTFTLRFASRG